MAFCGESTFATIKMDLPKKKIPLKRLACQNSKLFEFDSIYKHNRKAFLYNSVTFGGAKLLYKSIV